MNYHCLWNIYGKNSIKVKSFIPLQFSSVAQSCPTLCNPMNRCPSPTPRVYSNSCPSSRWCHPAPWTSKRPNQSILKEISPGCSMEGLMLKLKLQYFGHLMRRVDSLEKIFMLGGIGGRRRRERQRMRWLDGITYHIINNEI